MKYDVIVLRRAEADVHHIVRWIAKHSVQIDELAGNADSCSAAVEDPDCSIPLKQALFGTRHGSTYRAVFTIAGDQARILRFRGPGQPPLQEDELL